MFFDSHAHLNDPALDADREAVLVRAREAGVTEILNVAADPERWTADTAFRGPSGGPEIAAAVGLHPHDAAAWNRATVRKLERLLDGGGVRAVGEIGLDFHYRNAAPAAQEEAFRGQLRLARERNLPVIVHSRKAEERTMEILAAETGGSASGVIHCSSGGAAMARRALEMGWFLSFSGTVTFPNAAALRVLARELPLERILIETDTPYLAPQPRRGRRNEPAYVVHVAEVLARETGLSLADVARITRHNAMQLFGVGSPGAEGRIAYAIRDALYLNITNRCTNRCGFCVRYATDYVKGHNLRLLGEPSAAEVIRAVGDPRAYREVVFCGYGEPLLRLDLVKEVAAWIKSRGGRVRINTNGHAELIHGRDVLPELAGLVDAFSVSLNAENEEQYQTLCRPRFGPGTYAVVLAFVRKARAVAEVTVTVVGLPEVDVEACRELAEKELQVGFRLRYYDRVG